MPNMKFYVTSIISIFVALGIGIYIGFTLDTQSFVDEQKTDIVYSLEEKFDFLRDENQDLKGSIDDLRKDNKDYSKFVDIVFEDLTKDKLEGHRVTIIETKDDYMYSGLGQILENAGGNLTSNIIIYDKIMDNDSLEKLYEKLDIEIPKDNLTAASIEKLTNSLILGDTDEFVEGLIEGEFIKLIGSMDEPVDNIILAGGSIIANSEQVNLVDRSIVSTAKKMDMDKKIIGVEKLEINNSYMKEYKTFKISTVDNVDMPMGKIALILAMEGRPGHYGVKGTSEELVPDSSLPIVNYSKER